jgi:hypothetical protein
MSATETPHTSRSKMPVHQPDPRHKVASATNSRSGLDPISNASATLEAARCDSGQRAECAQQRRTQFIQSGEGQLHRRVDTGAAKGRESGCLVGQMVQRSRFPISASPRTIRIRRGRREPGEGVGRGPRERPTNCRFIELRSRPLGQSVASPRSSISISALKMWRMSRTTCRPSSRPATS